ncbi:MAG: quinol:cytochrome c oxidoreductase monoheme cytochrome subunit [Chitinophagaceae bacterium]|nr:quinol:cytochrome c oxidoreductase monoheme cytochrome subunit [Chitinophagaceae bacterium]
MNFTYIKLVLIVSALGFFASCNHNFDRIPVHQKPRLEFAPNMYPSEAYEPVTVIQDSVNFPEAYNQMPGNNGNGNLRLPVANTIKRGFTPYHISKDSLEYASRTLQNPLVLNDQVLAEGEVLYGRFCQHCHGETGAGDGPVSQKLKGVANLAGGQLLTISQGHIFHVITRGKGRMLQHASQIEANDRWKIAYFVKEKLQKKQ